MEAAAGRLRRQRLEPPRAHLLLPPLPRLPGPRFGSTGYVRGCHADQRAARLVAVLAVVRRWTTPTRTLWAALWICLLAWVLAAAGSASTTYSEGALGGLVSPWNPMVVIFPLLLLVVLGAVAVDRSALALLGAVLVASFVVQTNISSLPPVVALVAVAGVTWVVTAVADRRGGVGRGAGRPAGAVPPARPVIAGGRGCGGRPVGSPSCSCGSRRWSSS